MATPKHEQVWDGLKALFASIEGDGGETYWYTPDAVIDYPEFCAACLNTPMETVYSLSPETSEVSEATFSDTQVLLYLRVSMARRFDDTTENPFDPPNPSRLQVQNRLIQDAVKKLNTDSNWKLGDAALRAKVTLEDRSAENTHWKGWAIAHLSIRVEYYYADAEP